MNYINVNVLDIMIVVSVLVLVALATIYLVLTKRTKEESQIFVLDTKFRASVTEILERLTCDVNVLLADRKDIIKEKMASDSIVRRQEHIITELRERLSIDLKGTYTFDMLFDTIIEIKKRSDEYTGSVDMFSVEIEKLRESLNNSDLLIIKK